MPVSTMGLVEQTAALWTCEKETGLHVRSAVPEIDTGFGTYSEEQRVSLCATTP